MIPSNEPSPQIMVYENVLDNPGHVLDLINKASSPWEEGGVAKSRYIEFLKNNNSGKMRDVDLKYVPFSCKDEESLEIKKLSHVFNTSFDKFENHYLNKYPVDIKEHEGYQVARYGVGQYFKDHVDATLEFPRKLSLVYYFNDDYEGGEIYFTKLNLKIKPIANSLIIFPSSDLYSHSANEITKGTKYAIVGFWN